MKNEPFIKMSFNGDNFTLEMNGSDKELYELVLNSLMAEPKFLNIITAACSTYVLRKMSDEDKANLN